MARAVAAASALAAAAAAAAPASPAWDVVVYGSTPAGIAAATAAGRLGLRVALYEPLAMIGGMGAAGNLALNDGGVGAERTGLAKEFALRNGAAYNLSAGTQVPHPESFVAAASFDAMLASANVSVSLSCRLLSVATAGAVPGAGARGAPAPVSVTSITVACLGAPVTAAVFIDASYDGDVMVAAGIASTSGREAVATYNESLAGARAPSWSGVSGPRGVSALKPDGTLLKYVANLTELTPAGEADDALMAFQHRMCISGDDDRVPWYPPPGYDPADFLLFSRALAANKNESNFFTSMPPSSLPGYPGPKKKYCLCCGITIGASDQPMLNKGWASASWERRQEIIADHVYFELGVFYFFANDPSVPESVRTLFSSYGLCRDEFVEFGYIPPQLYIRISNRLVGDFVLTQNNIAAPRSKPDSIGVGDWSFDEHMTGKYAVPQPDGSVEVMLEGNFWPSISPDGVNWYDVPYNVMVPKAGTGVNLLVPVAISASAVAYSSTRIENMFMSLGTAAGVAAAQVVSGAAPTVQAVNVTAVQAVLNGTFAQRVHGPPA
jgi:hypothetical protein